MNDFNENLACVKKNGKYGFVNAKGKVVVKTIYDDAHDFHNGLAYVVKGDKAYFINKTGKRIITIK